MNLEAISEIEDQLSTAIPAGDGPETFAWAHDWVGNYHEQGFAYDAADDVNLDLDATFTDAAADAVRFDGAVYGIPYGAETVALMYNEELVDGPPETLEELVEIMDDYHDPAEGQYGLSCPPADPYFTSTFLHAFGGYFFDDETESLGVDQDEFIEGVELLQESIWPYVPQDPAYESQVPVFDDGNARSRSTGRGRSTASATPESRRPSLRCPTSLVAIRRRLPAFRSGTSRPRSRTPTRKPSRRRSTGRSGTRRTRTSS